MASNENISVEEDGRCENYTIIGSNLVDCATDKDSTHTTSTVYTADEFTPSDFASWTSTNQFDLAWHSLIMSSNFIQPTLSPRRFQSNDNNISRVENFDGSDLMGVRSCSELQQYNMENAESKQENCSEEVDMKLQPAIGPSVKSLSDDKIYGSGRKRRRSLDVQELSSSASSTSSISEDIEQTEEPKGCKKECSEGQKRTILKSKIPRPITQKRVTLVKTSGDENSNYKTEEVNVKTIKEVKRPLIVVTKDNDARAEGTHTLPPAVMISREEYKVPKKRLVHPIRSPVKRIPASPISPYSLRPKSFLTSENKINTESLQVANKKIETPNRTRANTPFIRPGYQEKIHHNKPIIRGIRSPAVATNTAPIRNANIVDNKKTSNISADNPLLENSRKLNSLEGRFKIQLKRFSGQSRDFLGLLIQMKETKKILLSLGEKIKTLGGTLPAEIDNLEIQSVIQQFGEVINLNFTGFLGAETQPIINNQINIADFGTEIKEQNKALMVELDKLKGENTYKIAMFNKCTQEMKTLEQASELTVATCEDACVRQIELKNKLNECDKAIKVLISLTKESFNLKASYNKLKMELNEERAKLDAETKNRMEIELKLNQELINEQGRLKTELEKMEILQAQFSQVFTERNAAVQEKLELANQLEDVEELIYSHVRCAKQDSEKIEHLQQIIKDKDTLILKAETTISELKENAVNLQSQIIEMDLGGKCSYGSIVEMSEQLINNDEQLKELKNQWDQASNENAALTELVQFMSALCFVDISGITIDELINDPGEMLLIKEKIKDSYRKPPISTVSETLVHEQAEQIKEQAINIQNSNDELNRQNEKIQELMKTISRKEEEINYLKAKYSQLEEKCKFMDSLELQKEITVRDKQENVKDMADMESTDTNNSKLTMDQLIKLLLIRSDAISRLESKMKKLEFVHSMCSRRRARGESRIAHLESKLQNDPTCWENEILQN